MPSERLHMAEEWDSYARSVLPADAAENQRQELRRAFYAGAVANNALLTAAFISNPDKDFFQFINKINKELTDFLTMVMAGRA